MKLCRELGMTLYTLNETMSYSEMKLWYSLFVVEHREREEAEQRAELDAEVQRDIIKNRGRWR